MYKFMYKFLVLLLFSHRSLSDGFENDFVTAAIDRTTHSVCYDGSYISINYPNGDVPAYTDVCTDVLIRSYRAIGIDFQKLVH